MADYIDRDKTITAIEECIRVGDELYPITDAEAIMNHAFEVAASCVYNLPSADVKPVVHGRWEPYEFGDYHWHKCSVCGKADEYISHYGLEAVRNFCPNCGADMRGNDNERE